MLLRGSAAPVRLWSTGARAARRVAVRPADLAEDAGAWLAQVEAIRRLLRFGGRDYEVTPVLVTPGLLARVAGALDDAGIDVRWAKVATLGATAVDVFCLAVPGDEAAVRARAEEAVIAVLPEAAPPAPPEDEQTG